ncbi:MAG: GNAT family N-acetyltransferase [Gammaproteobacteria bacterium]|nr:GNAT family N-acetyltransferase [Gammaproteobacteria bacterium]
MNNQIEMVLWDKKFENQAYALLNQYKETSLLLLANLKNFGIKLTDDTYSADFKCLVKDNKVVGVFALTKIGNLLVQTDRATDYSRIIVDECIKSDIPLKGVVGNWEITKPIWDYVKVCMPDLKEKFRDREILFQLMLSDLVDYKSSHKVQILNASDYDEWDKLNKAFLKESGLGQNEGEDARQKRVLKEFATNSWYGLFVDGFLVSTSCHTANVAGSVQIGGVYTIPGMRGQGLATECVYNLLLDGKTYKNITQAILVTDEDNCAAIKVYENLGFKRIGYYGLFFGEYDKK